MGRGSRIATRSKTGPTSLELLWEAPGALLRLVLVGETLAAILTLAAWKGDPIRLFAVLSLATQFALALSLVSFYLVGRVVHELSVRTQGYVVLATAVVVTMFVALAVRFTFEPASSLRSPEWTALLLRLVGIVVLVGLLAAAAFQNYLQSRRLAVRAKQAELEALQARIRPHFLFNTLNTAAALVHQRPGEAEQLLLDLADLFRAALAGPREIPLSEELSLARRYLEIESLRFGHRLSVDWQLPQEIPGVLVPALSIQPIVENAVRHGVERVVNGGRIEIAVTITPQFVVVRVTNPVAPPGGEQPLGHSVGLNASQARIEAFTGGHGSVQAGRQGDLYVATVRLPLDRRPNQLDGAKNELPQ